MGLISVVAVGMGVLAAILPVQIASEFKAWTPWLAQRLVQRAVTHLPERYRARCKEEWQSHVDEVPGEVGKLIAAIGFLSVSRKIIRNVSQGQPQDNPSAIFDAIYHEPTMEEILASIRRVIAEDEHRPTIFRE